MYKLDSCVWEITLNCCFSCKYCGSKGGKARQNELSTDECLSVANQLSELGCRRVSLIGGEVFLRHDWDVIAKRLTDNGIRTSIITNGYIMDNVIIERIRNAGIEAMAVSLDSIEPVHDKYRQEGSFKRAELAIDRLCKSDIPVAVISTLNRENAEYLEELFGYLSHWPLYAWQLQACSPMGNAAKESIDYHFDFSRVIRFVNTIADSAPFMLGVADNIGYFTEEEGYIRGNRSGLAVFRGCQAGLSAIGIDSVGNVRGCESMYDDSFIEGNLRSSTLADIWNNPAAFAYNRTFSPDKLSGKCGICEYGGLCRGGCRSYNFFTNNKIYESPVCANTVS